MSVAPVVCSVDVATDLEATFRLFTARMADWWNIGTPGGGKPAAIVLEPWAGGRWFERNAAGVETHWGSVIEWDAPGRLLLAWQLNRQFLYDANFRTTVELNFTALEAGGTRVRLEHRDLERFGEDAPRIAGLLGGGWPTLLNGLRDFSHNQTTEVEHG